MQYPAKCYGSYEASEVYLSSSDHDDTWQANPGAAHLPVITLKAKDSPVIVEVYTRFSKLDLLPHDWQLIALSSDQEVNISRVKIPINRWSDYLSYLANFSMLSSTEKNHDMSNGKYLKNSVASTADIIGVASLALVSIIACNCISKLS